MCSQTPCTQTRRIRRQPTFRAHLSIRATNLGQAVRGILLSPSQVAKPTCGCLVAAEYLAKGYKLSDSILQRAIHLDCKFERRTVSFSWDNVYPRQPKRESRNAFSTTSSPSIPRLVPKLLALIRLYR